MAAYEFIKELVVFSNQLRRPALGKPLPGQDHTVGQLVKLAAEQLSKFLPLILKTVHEKKAKQMIDILVKEADREKSTKDITRFLQMYDPAQRNELLNGTYLYLLWGECATDVTKKEYVIPVE